MGQGFPGAQSSGWMLKHRLVMQKKVGRPLMVWEIVHHKDRNRQNNVLSNLELMSRNEHPTCSNCPYYTFYVEQTGNKRYPIDKDRVI